MWLNLILIEKFTPPPKKKKNVQPLLEAKMIKISKKMGNMDPSSDFFL